VAKDIFRFFEQPQFENPSLIVCWNEDTAKLGPKVMEYLTKKIGSRVFSEIEPTSFFALGGVAIENNVAQFPGSRFYYCENKGLIILKSSQPQFERYKFINAVLDVAEHYCKVKELFTINGIVAQIAHTCSRRIPTVFNQKEFQKQLRGYGLENMKYEGFPAISSYLLWMAKERAVPGASLWPEIPFYLAACEDFSATKAVLSFLNDRFNLDLEFTELDEEINNQDIKISNLREEDSQINDWIKSLESGLSIGEAEQVELIKRVSEILERGD